MQKLCDFEEKYRPFLVLFIVAFIAHLLFPLSWGDDAIFAARVDKMGFDQFNEEMSKYSRYYSDNFS